MNKDQFIEALIGMGYKEVRNDPHYHRFDKRNKNIVIQEWDTYTNVFYYKDIKNGSYEYNQFNIVSDFKKALANIKRYERKLGI